MSTRLSNEMREKLKVYALMVLLVAATAGVGYVGAQIVSPAFNVWQAKQHGDEQAALVEHSQAARIGEEETEQKAATIEAETARIRAEGDRRAMDILGMTPSEYVDYLNAIDDEDESVNGGDSR